MKKKPALALPIATGIAIIFLLYVLSYNPDQPPFPISSEGMVKVNVKMNGNGLQFSSECFAVTMNIHEVQALSIKNGIDNRIDVRPLTHDIMKEIFTNFDIKVVEVRIDSFENEIYNAKMFIRQGNKLLELDSRPSDAIGMAVRTGVPVIFSRQLLESKGVNTCR